MTVGCLVHPTPGYPFTLQLRIEYRLGRDGLAVTTTAGNPGELTLPFGVGFHPYLTVGSQPIDSAILRLPGTRRLMLDARSLRPGGPAGAGSEFDFTSGRPIGPTRMDTAFAGLHRDADGTAWASLDDPSGERGPNCGSTTVQLSDVLHG